MKNFITTIINTDYLTLEARKKEIIKKCCYLILSVSTLIFSTTTFAVGNCPVNLKVQCPTVSQLNAALWAHQTQLPSNVANVTFTIWHPPTHFPTSDTTVYQYTWYYINQGIQAHIMSCFYHTAKKVDWHFAAYVQLASATRNPTAYSDDFNTSSDPWTCYAGQTACWMCASQ